MNSKRILLSLFTFLVLICHGQSGLEGFLTPSDSLEIGRKRGVTYTQVGLGAITLIGLNSLWYSDFERSSFKTVDDGNEWLQIDKMGHVFSAYQLNRISSESFAWAGTTKNTQLILGSATSLGFLTTVEIFDGFSEEWGFSWTDFASNFLGSGLYMGQELLWKEQRMLVKYSFHRTKFARINPDTLGNGLAEEFIKDYNGQTYWLSLNLASFFPKIKIPKWLNLAVGIGAEGMIGGDSEDLIAIQANENRFNQFYISLDLDLTRINTNSHLLKTVFSLVNTLKIPFPTLEFSSKNPSKFHLLYF